MGIVIFNREIKLKDIIKVYPYGKRTLERWISNYRKYGKIGLEPKSTRPKTNPSETPIRVKERIIELRKETNFCAKKLFWKLEKENIVVNKNTIQKIIKEVRKGKELGDVMDDFRGLKNTKQKMGLMSYL